MKGEFYVSGNGNPKVFAIISLVVGIGALIFSFIPCVGYYALGPGIIATFAGALSFIVLKSKEEKTTIALAGAIIGAVAVSVATFQYFYFKEVFDTKSKIENTWNDLLLEKALESARGSYDSLGNDSTSTDSVYVIPADSID